MAAMNTCDNAGYACLSRHTTARTATAYDLNNGSIDSPA
jgi:hypothetical protein